MGRSKLLSDSAVLDRLLSEIAKVGPGGLTFSRASQAAGLSGASLVQRFASRDAMVEAVLLHAWDNLDAATAAADAGLPVTPVGAIDLLLRLSPGETAASDVTDGLLLLREDIRNPVLCARGAAWGACLAKALGRRLTDVPADAERLGWQMASVWQGAIIWWAFRRGSDAAGAIRAMLEDWCQSVGARPAMERDALQNRPDAGRSMKARLRADLLSARKARATDETVLLRALVAAIDNAEAPPPEADRRAADVHDFRSGSAEVARLELTGDQLQALFLAEIAERETAAAQYASADRNDRARTLLDEIAIVRRYLVRED